MSTCLKCGAPDPTVHQHHIVAGISSNLDYCMTCFEAEFGPLEEVKDMKRKVKVLHGPLLRKELENDRHHLKKVFSAKFEELCAGEPRFSVEACEFICMAVSYAARKDTIFQRKCGLNLTAQELVKTCEEYARETFGPSAKGKLKSWGLETSSDIGDLVFLLVENQILSKREDEKRGDFDQVPFLND